MSATWLGSEMPRASSDGEHGVQQPYSSAEPLQGFDDIVIQLTFATMQCQCMARPGIEPLTLGKRVAVRPALSSLE